MRFTFPNYRRKPYCEPQHTDGPIIPRTTPDETTRMLHLCQGGSRHALRYSSSQATHVFTGRRRMRAKPPCRDLHERRKNTGRRRPRRCPALHWPRYKARSTTKTLSSAPDCMTRICTLSIPPCIRVPCRKLSRRKRGGLCSTPRAAGKTTPERLASSPRMARIPLEPARAPQQAFAR